EPTARPGLEEAEETLRPVAHPTRTPAQAYPAPVPVPVERPTPTYVELTKPHAPAPEDARPQPAQLQASPPVSASTQAATQSRSEPPSSSPADPTLRRPLRGAANGATRPGAPAAVPRRKVPRRTALLAVLGTAAVATAVAVLVTTTAGGGDGRAAGTSPTASTARPATPAPTVEGTARPRTLPPGAHEEAGGFAWVTPKGWRRDVKTGAEVHYTSPDGSQELVAKSSLARGDLMDSWSASERSAHQGQDYSKIRLAETEFRGHPAVIWEYTFTLEGVPWHARLLGFDTDGKSYQINTWYQPAVETQAVRTYERVKEDFTLL
ncbi:serine/threonine protein kinase, partial [Streptomyces sp. NPDC048279]